MPWHIEASRLPQHLSLSSFLMPTPTHRKHSVAPFKQQAFLPTTGTVAHNNICGFFHGPASLCNLCTTWESVTEHSKDKIVPIPPFAMWRPNTSNCSLLKAICSFLPGGWYGILNCALLPSVGQVSSVCHLYWWAVCLEIASSRELRWLYICKVTASAEANDKHRLIMYIKDSLTITCFSYFFS